MMQDTPARERLHPPGFPFGVFGWQRRTTVPTDAQRGRRWIVQRSTQHYTFYRYPLRTIDRNCTLAYPTPQLANDSGRHTVNERFYSINEITEMFGVTRTAVY